MKKLSLKELGELQTVESLFVHSLERMIYQVSLITGGEEYLLYRDANTPFRSASLTEIKELFLDKPIGAAYLRHDSPYDEMIGQPNRASNRLEISLGW